MAIFNLGSLNIDRVFRVPRIVAGGETLASTSLATFAGGKGANQSIALARAGAEVVHVGKIGPDGGWLVDLLAREHVDTRWVKKSEGPTGQAMIQVDDAGQNAIVLLGGANQEITAAEIDAALATVARAPVALGTVARATAAIDSWLLVQNETSSVAHAIRRAKELELRVAFNPAPFDDRVRQFPLVQVDLLCVNETEGAALAGQQSPDEIAATLAQRWPHCEILLTLGAEGAIWRQGEHVIRRSACRVEVVDTTAAGDTLLGYFLTGRSCAIDAAGQFDPAACLDFALAAAALCVSRPGAIDSIPRREEVERFYSGS